MTTYKLKEDWSSFKAGDKFKLVAYNDGDLYQLIDGSDNYVLAKIPKELLDKVDDGGCWEPAVGERYYCMDEDGDILSDIFSNDMNGLDKCKIALGNCFKTRRDAQAMVDWLRTRQRLIESGAVFMNASDLDEGGIYYHVIFNREGDGSLVCYMQGLGGDVSDRTLYFADRDIAKKSIEEHKDDWLTYLGVKEKSDGNS